MNKKRPPTRRATHHKRTTSRNTKPASTKVAQSRPTSWQIHCTIESTLLKIPSQSIRSIVRSTLKHVAEEIALSHVSELHVMVINDARMREINFEFRKKDKPTDVLSFPQYTPQEIRGSVKPQEPAGSYLGDLVISSETTIRQAKRFGVTVRAELARLIIHGILHLIGYDHEGVPAREAQAMRRRERVLRELIA